MNSPSISLDLTTKFAEGERTSLRLSLMPRSLKAASLACELLSSLSVHVVAHIAQGIGAAEKVGVRGDLWGYRDQKKIRYPTSHCRRSRPISGKLG
jgi:hypothetical protein